MLFEKSTYHLSMESSRQIMKEIMMMGSKVAMYFKIALGVVASLSVCGMVFVTQSTNTEITGLIQPVIPERQTIEIPEHRYL